MTKARDLANVEAKATLTDTQTLTNKTLTSPVLGGTTTTASGNLAVQPATYVLEVKGGASTEGAVQLNCAVNTHGQIIKSQPHAQAASNTLLLPGGTTIGNSNAVLVSDTGTQTLTNKTLTSAVLTGTLTAGGSVGTNGQFLQSTGTGVQYATPSAGAYTSLASGSIAAAATGVDISSISGAYKDLILIANGVSNTTSGENCNVRFNNDSGNNYQSAVFDRTNLGGAGLNTENKIAVAFGSVPANTNGQIIVEIPNYTDTTSSQLVNATSFIGANVYFGIGSWNTNDAVTRVQLLFGGGAFDAGTYELFGVK